MHLFNDLSKRFTCIFSSYLRSAQQLCKFLLISVLLHCLYIKNFLLLKSGDIKSNPRPCKSSALKFCRWNLNGLAAQEFTKLSLLEGYINVNDIDIICLSETYNLLDISRKECLVTEIMVKNKRCFLTCLYRFPSQNRKQFQSFCDLLTFL